MFAFWIPPAKSQPSLRLLCAALIAASGLLAIRLHSLRAFMVMLALGAQLLVAAFSAEAISYPVMGLLLAADFGLVLLVEDTFFDWEAVAWWGGLLGVQWVMFLMASRWAPAFMADVARPTFDLGVARVGFVEIGVALVLTMLFLRFALSLDAVAAGMLWSLAALAAGLRATSDDGHLALAAFAIGIAVVERSHWIAYHDELTGLPGRRAFNEALAGLGETFSVAIVDVDHFKQFNDSFGHDTGDQVLRKVARHLGNVGGGGTAYRCGGEEFAVVFAKHGITESHAHAEALRQAIEADVFTARGPGRSTRERPDRRNTTTRRKQPAPVVTRVTVSIGLAEWSERIPTAEQVILAADKALYQAKHNGRNRVELAQIAKPRVRGAAAFDPSRQA
ncbi:MAG TPA: GGDEF domain-containing protein [Terriglobales bacterium]|nr:GGDEF domain-containing protein [Terriglobales bacterium]